MVHSDRILAQSNLLTIEVLDDLQACIELALQTPLKWKKLKATEGKLLPPSSKASHCQAVEALACILETEAFFEDVLALEPAQCISDRSGR